VEAVKVTLGPARASEECVSSDLLVGFVNTRAHAKQDEDLLADGAAVAKWFEAAGAGENTEATNADAATARELRGALLGILRAHVGCDEGAARLPEAESHLQRAALRFPVSTVVTAEGCELRPSGAGIDRSFSYLLSAVADLASRGAWPRMKVCKNDTCYSAFFDKTRNSSALYCSTTCSGQMATRAYRGRKKDCTAS
jgi:predicted RNA-binding Zn ribbon-like protein